jgi:hypothetical protein
MTAKQHKQRPEFEVLLAANPDKSGNWIGTGLIKHAFNATTLNQNQLIPSAHSWNHCQKMSLLKNHNFINN